jgi:hypothetical protein
MDKAIFGFRNCSMVISLEPSLSSGHFSLLAWPGFWCLILKEKGAHVVMTYQELKARILGVEVIVGIEQMFDNAHKS